MTITASTYRRRSHIGPLPGQSVLTHFAAAFFTLTLFTDWAYVQTTILMWRDFSSWLLLFGMVIGGFGVLLWMIGLVVGRRDFSWIVIVLNASVLAVAFVNNLVHAGDGWSTIMPLGIGLSLLTCVLMLASAVLRRQARRTI